VTPSTVPRASTEACDNCADDDADGLVDLEDPDCCARPAVLTLEKGSLAIEPRGHATVKLKATLSESALTPGPALAQDLTVQLRRAEAALLCARFPASRLRRQRAKIIFRGRRHRLASAHGIDGLTLAETNDGHATLAIFGKGVSLTVPTAGSIALTLGLHDPTTAEPATTCVSGAAPFRATRKGLRLDRPEP
jgi:hypothetical protein